MSQIPFGTRLRLLRERAGLSETELAYAVQVKQGDVSTWERNAAVPQLSIVERIAAFLGVTAVELLTGQPLVNPPKQKIRLTADNFANHLSTDYAKSLLIDYTVSADGIDPDDWIVRKLLAWVQLQSNQSPEVTYAMSPVIAGIFLERLAQWH